MQRIRERKFIFLSLSVGRTIILPVVLYGCETWSLTLREKRRLRVFENRVLRRIFGPKKDEAMNVGPCHHDMARPQVADGGMAPYMEGSCE
jgi:hypothetical protein